MSVANANTKQARDKLMRKFLKKLVHGDRRSKQLFRLYYDRGEISEEQFFRAIQK